MDFDRILRHTGRVCPYIVIVVVLLCCFNLSVNMHNASVNFLSPHVDHWCYIPGLQNLSQEEQKYLGIPFDSGQNSYAKCSAYNITWEDSSEGDLRYREINSTSKDDVDSIPCQDGWSYDHTTYGVTTTSEWDLVCGKSWVAELVSPVYLSGLFVGSLISGHISDTYGRMPTLLISVVMILCSGLGAVFSFHEAMYIICRLLLGLGNRMAAICNVVIGTEIISPQYRSSVVGISRLFYSTGPLLLVAIAYFVRDFRPLQFLLIAPITLLIPLYWFIPESPRWLMSRGRYEEARESVLKLAHRARTTVPPAMLRDCRTETATCKSPRNTSTKDMFYHPLMRKWTLAIGFTHLASMMVYMAVSMNLDSMFGDVYQNTILAALTEIPAVFLVLYALQRFGRKFTMQACFGVATLGGTLSIVLILTKVDPMAVTVTLIVIRCAAGGAVCSCTTLATELFPSYMRQTAVGITSAISSVFTIFSPFIGEPLEEVWAPLPSLVFTLLSAIAILLNLRLPETLGKPMPESVEDAEKLASADSFVSDSEIIGCPGDISTICQTTPTSGEGKQAPNHEKTEYGGLVNFGFHHEYHTRL